MHSTLPSQQTRIPLSMLAHQEGVALSTAWRWVLRGIRGHRLSTIVVGGRRYTTQNYYQLWLAKINGVDSALDSTTDEQRLSCSPSERERQLIAAEELVIARGHQQK